MTIAEMQAIAATRGGRCLSATYVNTNEPLEWECAQGHRWQAAPGNVKRGQWCARCARQRRSASDVTIDDMQTLAGTRGGRCLSAEYVNTVTPLEWECAKGHRWQATPASVTRGSWCLRCARQKPRGSRVTIDDMHAVAEARGGRCLSAAYVNGTTSLEWECAEGHRWFAKPAKIKEGRWCRACVARGRPRLTLAEVQRSAGERGGRCLSDEYAGSAAPLLFECAAGHRWHASATTIRSGNWCPQCYRELWYCTLEEMRALAASHGGECLSQTYENQNQLLRWRCVHGHEWESPAQTAKRHWCRMCYHEGRRLGIERMREIAASHGGLCLSDEYVSVEHRLQWQCAEGHTWWTRAGTVSAGHWCPECAWLALCRKNRSRRKYLPVGTVEGS